LPVRAWSLTATRCAAPSGAPTSRHGYLALPYPAHAPSGQTPPRLVDDGDQVRGALQRADQPARRLCLARALERERLRERDRGEEAARAQRAHQVHQLREQGRRA